MKDTNARLSVGASSVGLTRAAHVGLLSRQSQHFLFPAVFTTCVRRRFNSRLLLLLLLLLLLPLVPLLLPKLALLLLLLLLLFLLLLFVEEGDANDDDGQFGGCLARHLFPSFAVDGHRVLSRKVIRSRHGTLH